MPRYRVRGKQSHGAVRALAITSALTFLGAALLLPRGNSPNPAINRIRSAPITVRPGLVIAPANVWLVEAAQHFDLYSNGLRVENQFSTSSQPRRYVAYRRNQLSASATERRDDPSGIVFHTTESHIAPFEEDHNQVLRRDGEGMLEYVSRRRSYHFVIDRFGRVFRIVRESDSANHAGNSVWADQNWIYVNLNQSFFGIAFEAQSSPDGETPPVNAAQVHAARILTEMLRARYHIAGANCVAHAQVSINPANRRAGYHTDWAANLPFQELGLGNNYQYPLPSVTLFGFRVDEALAAAGGAPLAQGLQAAEDSIREEAARRGLDPDRYRQALQRKYTETVGMPRAKGIPQETN
jgi:N-acetylmuramoyl-L-alanine amidase-like protein